MTPYDEEIKSALETIKHAEEEMARIKAKAERRGYAMEQDYEEYAEHKKWFDKTMMELKSVELIVRRNYGYKAWMELVA